LLPIDCAMPAACACWPNASDTNWLPWSECQISPGVRPPARERHLQRVADELAAHVVSHPPADDPAAVEVLHRDQIQPALPGAQVGDVGDPAAVRCRRGEVTIKQLEIRPDRPASRISRSTRLRPIRSPSSKTRSAQIRGEP